jgi:sugar phosphate isomerase/epimerase
MSYSIATVSISGLLANKLEAAKSAGFSAIEIFENDLLSAPQTPAEINAILDDLGLDCAMLQPFRDYEGMPTGMRDCALERFRRKFAVMDDLGTDLILLCSNCSPHSSGERQQQLDDLALLAETAKAYGKRVAYEALAWGRHVDDHRDAWGLVRDVDHPALGLCLDSFHSLARDIPVSSIGDIRADKLFIVQMADAPHIKADLLDCWIGSVTRAITAWKFSTTVSVLDRQTKSHAMAIARWLLCAIRPFLCQTLLQRSLCHPKAWSLLNSLPAILKRKSLVECFERSVSRQ